MKQETEFTNTDFVVLKPVKKLKNIKLLKKKEGKFFCLGKILLMQTIN